MARRRTPPASTTARGYGTAHQKERARLTPLVTSGQATCQQPTCLYPTRTIHPSQPWDLGHNEDRTAWIGPTHRRCNQQAGATKGGNTTATKHRGHHHPRPRPTTPWHSTHW